MMWNQIASLNSLKRFIIVTMVIGLIFVQLLHKMLRQATKTGIFPAPKVHTSLVNIPGLG